MPASLLASSLPRPTLALMYHALSQGQTPAGQDPRYTLDVETFEQQLLQLEHAGGAGSATDGLLAGRPTRFLLTFDDGHVSNYQHAYPALQARGMRADFFVNPAIVGQPGFASWTQLREMSDAGMSIQSHGYDHVYLTQLSPAVLRDNLLRSREEISQRIGAPVHLLAPPGGRMPRHLHQIARECGYRHVLSSQPGPIGDAIPPAILIPRMAMTRAIGPAVFQRWLAGDRKALLRERLRYGGLALAKNLLGDQRYERARNRALSVIRGPV